jgi:ribosome-associated protein
MTPKKLAHKIADLALDKRAYDVKILDLRGLSTVCDYFVICSADADVQAKAISDHIVDKLKEGPGVRPWHTEGYKSLRWVLLDYVDVVVHVFLRDVRSFYGLEELWGDAPVEEIAA